MAVPEGIWCRACGVDLSGPSDTCPFCGTPLTVPAGRETAVGTVLVLGRATRRNGVVVGESPQGLDVLTTGGSPRRVGREEARELARVAVPGPRLLTPAGRLWAVGAAVAQGALIGGWAPDLLEAAADTSSAGLAERRAAALDALALDQPDRIDRLALSPGETAWYRAHAAAAAGDAAGLVALLESLPPQRYSGRVRLLLAVLPALLADPGLAARARRSLAGMPAAHPQAAALALALRPQGGAESAATAVTVARLLDPVAAAGMTEVAQSLLGSGPLPTEGPVPEVRALGLHRRGMSGGPVDPDDAALALLPDALLDDLVESGALRRPPAPGPSWSSDRLAYLQARIDPEHADAQTLGRARAFGELARRRFLEGDLSGLEALPGDDPAVRHYRALAALRRSERLDAPEGLRPEAAARVAAVHAYAAALESAPDAGTRPPLPGAVAEDPSFRPFLRAAVAKGTLELTPDERLAHPLFAAWVDLCALQAAVFDERWEDVARRGRDLADAAKVESLSDEAQNMVAFAELQLGRPEAALEVLDEALYGQFTDGLVVNAAVVAAQIGPGRAAPFLARAFVRSRDPAVREGALRRAVQLWNASGEGESYPEALRDLLRAALRTEITDPELHRGVLTVVSGCDGVWLASQQNLAALPAQRSMADYYWVVAATGSKAPAERLADLSRALVSTLTAQGLPPWAQAELRRQVALLDRMVHVRFGEASWAADPVRVLKAARILELPDELVLSAQAGAHLVISREEAGGSVEPEVEQTLLLDTAETFRRRREELGAAQEYVGQELGRCLWMASVSMAIITSRAFEGAGPVWAALVRRREGDRRDVPLVRRRQSQVLDALQADVDRCTNYRKAMAKVPLPEKGREWLTEFTGDVRNWQAEIRRLRGLV